MTTIAADLAEGVMCADSHWTDGDECGTCRKVWRVRGGLVGLAGPLDQMQRWLAAVRAGKNPTGAADVTALRLDGSGISSWNGVEGWIKLENVQMAMGTGSKAARGAMAAGASCKRAVQIACLIDAGSRGPVRVYRLTGKQ